MQRFIATMVALWCVTAATLAGADDVWGTRSSDMTERSHNARLTMHPGYAELRVRRTVQHGGERHDQAVFRIDVPAAAVAVGLRTLGSVDGAPRWFSGELMEAEDAAARYRELTGLGVALPKDPALLSWRSDHELALQVFPIAPGAPKTVEYTYLLPTEYRRGAHHLMLPAMGSGALRATLSGSGAGGQRLLIDGKPQRGRAIPQPDRDPIDIALAAKRAPSVGGALAVVPFGEGRVLTRFRLEAAPKLSKVPRGARIVVIVDTSRSLEPAQLNAQLTAARHYLGHFADARVEVLTFDRKVRRQHGGFVAAVRAARDLASMTRSRHNGSEVEAALLEAHALLDAWPSHHPKRILLLTDTLTRRALDARRLRASLDRNVIVHVGVVFAGEPSLRRDSFHPWSEVIQTTGGLVWAANASAEPQHQAAMRHLYEEWARPVRLHDLAISAPRIDVSMQLDEDMDALDEGESISALWIDDDAAPWLTVEGKLWTQTVSRRLLVDPAESKRWSALVFGSEVKDELDDQEMMRLALRGGAVSPVTSYLAIEPGVRPSREGLEVGQGFGSGSVGLRGVGTSRRGVPPVEREELQRFLEAELGAARRNCGIASRTTSVTLETTRAEIASVSIATAGTAVENACLERHAWMLQLPDTFIEAHHRWVVRV